MATTKECPKARYIYPWVISFTHLHCRKILRLLIRPICTIYLRTRAMYIFRPGRPSQLASPCAYFRTRKALYIPFHLLLRRLQCLPAHKQYILRRDKILDPPASPTPFFFPLDQDSIQTDQIIRFGKCRNRGTKRSREQVPVIRFNSNSICFICPPDFYAAGSTVYLYNEPKLLPVHGLVIPPNPTRNGKPYSHCGRAFTYKLFVR